MTEHVAQFAGPGLGLDLPPAQAARAPVLQPAGPEMIRLPQIPALDEMRQVTQGRHEPVRKRRHVPHPGALGGFRHGPGIRRVQRQRFFAKDMFPVGNRRQRDGGVGEIRRGNDDRMQIVALHNLLIPGGNDCHARPLPRVFQGDGIGVAKGGQFHVGTEGQPGQMILQGDAATPDDGKVKRARNRHRAPV
ncbi:MAG: hypothetical protein BWX84_01372 [Verrucomicrobia bacterium ADurb.Bin118]|nr:MAG: hypothetical protein BWX84_01372 [Verrucomicrobia bacterium ADurb.Bin118]